MGLPHFVLLFGGPPLLILFLAWLRARPSASAEERTHLDGLDAAQIGCLVAFGLAVFGALLGLYILNRTSPP